MNVSLEDYIMHYRYLVYVCSILIMNEVNIIFEDRIEITNGVYDGTSALGMPIILNFGQKTVNV